MKNFFKTFLICTVAVSLLGCRSEIESVIPDPSTKDNGAITFLVGDNAATKSASRKSQQVVREMIPFAQVGSNTLYLEESMTSLDERRVSSASTKGLPIYTENFGEKYENFGAAVYSYKTATTSADTLAVSGLSTFTGGSNKFFRFGAADKWPLEYKYEFDGGIWPTDMKDDQLLFFLSAPDQVAAATAGVSNLQYFYTKGTNKAAGKNKGVIKFEYTSPASAAEQADVLFTTKSIDMASYNKAQYENGKHDKASVLFYHTLAGVKFKAGNIGDCIRITKIELIGIKNTGKCTVNPQYEDDGYELTSGDHSNKAGTTAKSRYVSKWTDVSGSATFALANATGLDINTAASGQFPASFYGDDVENNNLGENNYMDEDFTNVFFFVPQTTASGAKIKITYDILEGTTVVESGVSKEIAFAGHKWFAGELYTYTITAKELGVYITDTVSGASFDTKKDVEITNTRNTTSYIRVAVVGNWFDSNAKTVGELGELAASHIIVNHAWNETANQTEIEGVPTNTTDVLPINSDYWIKVGDFYYYKYKVKGGASTLYPLFSSVYKYICTPKDGCHLEMSLAVQAVDADKVSTAWPGVDIFDDGIDDGTQITGSSSDDGDGESE